MKKSLLLTAALLIAAAVLPLAVYASHLTNPLPLPAPAQTTAATPDSAARTSEAAQTTAQTQTTVRTTAAEPPAIAAIGVLLDGIRTELAVEDAVAAIVAAEMPALFPKEALKAQAVAARTYIAYRTLHPVSAHADAVICDDPSHCCALADIDTLAAGWGEDGGDYAARILTAVSETAGEIITFDGEPIMAVFHAMSSAKTNSAADVWGGSIGYLVSVDAPAEEAELTGYRDSAVFSAEEFRTCFLALYPDAVLDPQKLDWFSAPDYAESGLLRSLAVGGVTVSGQELRTLCGLRSAAITVTQGTGRIRFDTVGYGHGVGMSQHGAKVLALRGLSHRAILEYYYTGVSFGQIDLQP